MIRKGHFYILLGICLWLSSADLLAQGVPSLQWAYGLSGRRDDRPSSIKLDGHNNFYVAGSFSDSMEVDPAGTGMQLHARSYQGQTVDAFLLKYNADCQLIYARSFGTFLKNERIYDMAIDSSDNVYLFGTFEDEITFAFQPGAAPLVSHGSSDLFIAKYDSAGNYVFAISIGSSNIDQAKAIDVDANQNIYITGKFWGTCDFNPSVVVTNNLTASGFSNNGDIFLASYDSHGNYRYAIGIGNKNGEYPVDVTVDQAGNAVIVGAIVDTVDFDPGPGEVKLKGSSSSSGGIYVAKYDTLGQLIYAKTAYGPYGGDVKSACTDKFGNVYVTGTNVGEMSFDTTSTAANMVCPNGCYYVSKFNAAGDHSFSFNSNVNTGSEDISVNSRGEIFVFGEFGDTADLDPGPGVVQVVSGSPGVGDDMFLAKFDSVGNYMYSTIATCDYDIHSTSFATTEDDVVYATGFYQGKADFDDGPGYDTIVNHWGPHNTYLSKFALSDVVLTTTTATATCNGSHDGTINITATGGQPPYTYNVRPGYTNNTGVFNNMAQGGYTYLVTDSNGVVTRGFVELAFTDSISATEVVTDESCAFSHDGAVQLNGVGGIAPYHYTIESDSSYNTTGLYTGLRNNYYDTATIYTVYDSIGCYYSDTFKIGLGFNFLITTASTGNDCYGDSLGTLDATVTGAGPTVSYLWSTGDTVSHIDGVPAGVYTLTVTDDSTGCAFNRTEYVSGHSRLRPREDAVRNVSCYGSFSGRAGVTCQGGSTPYQFYWSTGAQTHIIDSVVAGTYYVTITDDLGCEAYDTIILTQPDTLVLQSSIQDLLCSNVLNGAIQTTVTGGLQPYNYGWDTGDTSASLANLAAGQYELILTDSNHCTIQQTYQVDATNFISSAIVRFDSLTSTLSVADTFDSYQWILNGSPIAGATGNSYPISVNGYYSVEVTVGSCSTSSTIAFYTPYVGIDDPQANLGIQLYPNPTSGIVQLTFERQQPQAKVLVYNIDGQLLTELNIENTTSTEIDLGKLPGTVYFIKVLTEQGSWVKRVVKR